MLANREVSENLAVCAGRADYAVIANIGKRAFHSCVTKAPARPGPAGPGRAGSGQAGSGQIPEIKSYPPPFSAAGILEIGGKGGDTA